MNRSLTAPRAPRITTQSEATDVLREALTAPFVTVTHLREAISRTARLKRHCRDEIYGPTAEPQSAAFVLALTAAKLAANACDNIALCVDGYRADAQALADYTIQLDLVFAELCDDVLRDIIARRAFPACLHNSAIGPRMYNLVSRMESDRVRALRRLIAPAEADDELMQIAS